ncbi:MAG: sulfatase-like hydrolase/transferase [Phycisphaerae bacterium]
MLTSDLGSCRSVRSALLAALVCVLTVGAACEPPVEPPATPASPVAPPNILWVVWDTVRADHLSLYGYGQPTTPRLGQWARGARVFEDCTSSASSTVPSHAAMFTGLLPSEHGTHADHQFLDDKFHTVAELLRERGYQTYLYSANPHISSAENFHQGFEVEEHPWDPQYQAQAVRIMQAKVIPQDASSELPAKVRARRLSRWDIKASGELTGQALETWLARRDPGRPFFAFLNYMEAHRPFVPPQRYRQRMMTPEQVQQSYRVDRSWGPMWRYVFGLHQYSQPELAVMAATYDATLAELDDLFADLMASLESKGHLENTVIILTGDHGEHLGEHHLLDHQYSLYQPLIRVPLVVKYAPKFAPGRDPRPVMNFDIFPTILELAGIPMPAGLASKAVSLTAPRADRVRLAEYPAVFKEPFAAVRRTNPQFDSRPWHRLLSAVIKGDYKYIRGTDSRAELYNLRDDRLEARNLLGQRPALDKQMAQALDRARASLRLAGAPDAPVPEMTEQQRRLLESLGYVNEPK